MRYWEAVPFRTRQVISKIHTDRKCRHLVRAERVRRVTTSEGRRFCSVCAPAQAEMQAMLDEARLLNVGVELFDRLPKGDA
jgi:hypothetical protein